MTDHTIEASSIESLAAATDDVADPVEATVTITINAVNDVPIAADDLYGLALDDASTLIVDNLTLPGVLANDTDVDGDSLTVMLVSDVEHGSLTLISDGSFEYTPDQDFTGADSFTYRATDGSVDSLVATVSINVSSFNNGPVTVNDEYTVDEDAGLTTNETDGVRNLQENVQVVGQGHGLGAFRQLPPFFGILLQIRVKEQFPALPAHEFHREEILALLVPAHHVHGNDVGVVEFAGDEGLGREMGD